mgnify:CR=1 FL=1|tara:strand:- start:8395 stop:8592 length:198 start_codon:yes stop_codon:yes gene_type:complete
MPKKKNPFVVLSVKASEKVGKKAKKIDAKIWDIGPRKSVDVTAAKKVLKRLTGKKHPESRRGSKD